MKTAATILPTKAILFLFAALSVCILLYIVYRKYYETPENVRNMVAAQYASANQLIQETQGKRFGMEKYLKPCEGATDLENCKKDDLYSNLDETQIVLSNFYFQTVRVPGCFFGTEPVFSVDAIKFACLGGARAFVFDIWPSMDARGGFRPILQLVEQGSNWRRISMNTMEFETAVETIVSTIYGGTLVNQNYKTDRDMTLFYLRFQGVPRPETYKSVAETLAKHTQPYLLDPSFAYARGDSRLVKTSIRDLQGKLLLFTNKTKQELNLHQEFFSFVNMCAPSTNKDSIAPKLEYTLEDLQHLTPDDKRALIRKIQSSITFLILPTHHSALVTNDWDWKPAYDLGIHCIAMNIFERGNERSRAYFNMFSRYSYKWKPEWADISSDGIEGFQNKVPLRLPLVVLPPAKIPENPGIGDGTLNVSAEFLSGDRCADMIHSLKKELDDIYGQFTSYIKTINSEMTSPQLQNQSDDIRKSYLENVVTYTKTLIQKYAEKIKDADKSLQKTGCKEHIKKDTSSYEPIFQEISKQSIDINGIYNSFISMIENIGKPFKK